MANVYKILNNKVPYQGLKPNTSDVRDLEDFLHYLMDWEILVANPAYFLSKETALGFHVTIKSVLQLLHYCTSALGMKYLLTAKLTQDILEYFFGLVRQSTGSNNNPTPSDFFYMVHLLSVYNLAKAPVSGNCGVHSQLEVLTKLKDIVKNNPKSAYENTDCLLEGWITQEWEPVEK